MTVSLIVNTGALALHAEDTKSSGGVPYSWRTYWLRNFLLPMYVADLYIDEVIVAGVWEEGPGYTYVPVLEGRHGSWKDCIAQRQAGFEASKGDIVIHQHDDHLLWLDDDSQLEERVGLLGNQVIVPQRWTRLRNPHGERLNHGEPSYNQWNPPEGYIGGHCAIYRREVLERCPWKAIPLEFTLDVIHTAHIRAAGYTVAWSDALKVWDVERGSTPWL